MYVLQPVTLFLYQSHIIVTIYAICEYAISNDKNADILQQVILFTYVLQQGISFEYKFHINVTNHVIYEYAMCNNKIYYMPDSYVWHDS